jgi:AraC family transcriptional regulator, transcriptional activator of pobA
MELSSAGVRPDGSTRLAGRREDGTPVYTYRRLPGLPPVSVLRFGGAALPEGLPHGAHAHDFLVLAYFDTGGGSVLVNGREWPITAGDAFVIPPGEVIAPGRMRPRPGVPRDDVRCGGGAGCGGGEGFGEACGGGGACGGGEGCGGGAADPGGHLGAAWAAFFPIDVFGPPAAGSLRSWHAHPLLLPYLTGAAGGVQPLHVPAADRLAWSQRFAALERELTQRSDGYGEAALAHLMLLLVSVSRLATDIAGDLARRDEPLLATVFDAIEARYREPVSLQHIAAEAGLTPGHLTTVVGRKTGRTVQQWITERRMSEARRLLAGSDLTVEAVAIRVGYRDASYFIRTFRRSHGVTPLDWRRAGRS